MISDICQGRRKGDGRNVISLPSWSRWKLYKGLLFLFPFVSSEFRRASGIIKHSEVCGREGVPLFTFSSYIIHSILPSPSFTGSFPLLKNSFYGVQIPMSLSLQ